MKRKAFSILLALVLVLSLNLVMATPAMSNDVESSTMIFEGTLTDNGDGTYTGVIPMVDESAIPVGDGEAGYDIYAEEGASAWFGDDPGTGPVWTEQEISDHDAWPSWPTDTPDWYQYSLNFTVEDGLQKWAVRNHPSATAQHPWYETGYEKIARGVPMSGTMDWAGMYAAETDIGAYLPGTGTPEIPDGAVNYGGGPMCWDMDWSWGSEVVPLQYPGFSVEVIPLGDSSYRVIMTPALPSYGFVTGGGWIDSPPHAYMPGPNGPDPVGTIVVTPANVGVDWLVANQAGSGNGAFVSGPATPPLGVGSFQMNTTGISDKYTLFNYSYMGVKLADITELGYSTYGNSNTLDPALQMEIDPDGPDISGFDDYATLNFEPYYANTVTPNTWQTWDVINDGACVWATGFTGPGSISQPVTWQQFLSLYPDATIKYGFGVNVGSGWSTSFTGHADALTISVNGVKMIYDFEPVAPPTGKATFGFVSKYKKGASLPDGQTQFVFRAADLNFHSDSYEWMIIAGDNARFKGIGTVNGEEGYRFMLWAGDGDQDTFRIKIWTEDNGVETVIYDNGMHQPIAGGNIVIHNK